MTDKLREAAQQALEALEEADSRDEYRSYGLEITALRAALAEQPAEQEPVAPRTMIVVARRGLPSGRHSHTVESDVPLPIGTKLYTAPQPAKQPLTDEEITTVAFTQHNYPRGTVGSAMFRKGVRFAERTHGINVPQARGETK